MTASSNVSDTIEREIFIAAPVEKVWELVSVPGWWINDGTLDLESVERLADDRAVVHHSDAGDLLVDRGRVADVVGRIGGQQARQLDRGQPRGVGARLVELRELLGLPADALTMALIPMGYPAQGRWAEPKRRPVEEVVHWNRWGTTRERP